jgi:hypothetical protein
MEPKDMGVAEVEEYLTHLVAEQQVAPRCPAVGCGK